MSFDLAELIPQPELDELFAEIDSIAFDLIGEGEDNKRGAAEALFEHARLVLQRRGDLSDKICHRAAQAIADRLAERVVVFEASAGTS